MHSWVSNQDWVSNLVEVYKVGLQVCLRVSNRGCPSLVLERPHIACFRCLPSSTHGNDQDRYQACWWSDILDMVRGFKLGFGFSTGLSRNCLGFSWRSKTGLRFKKKKSGLRKGFRVSSLGLESTIPSQGSDFRNTMFRVSNQEVEIDVWFRRTDHFYWVNMPLLCFFVFCAAFIPQRVAWSAASIHFTKFNLCPPTPESKWMH